MPGRHLSIRMDQETFDHLDHKSRYTGEPRSRLAKRLIEEGLRMEEHPGIVFRPGPTGRRAGLAAGPDVWEVIEVLRGVDLTSDDAIRAATEHTSVDWYQVRVALRYYADYRDEIDERIRVNGEERERGYAAWLRQQAVLAG